MRLDHKKWTDIYDNINLTYGPGYLTNEAKELMKEMECYTLEQLLDKIEKIKQGYWYDDDTRRPDVNISGHQADINNPNSPFYYMK